MLKAISVKQPWATALLTLKDVENRTWKLPKQYIGIPIALHASKNDREEYRYYSEFCFMHQMSGSMFDIPYGSIIGIITFSECVTEMASSWFFGEYGWVKKSIVALPDPIPCNGSLGFWTVPAEVEKLIRDQVSF
jgi:hypothetical protein